MNMNIPPGFYDFVSRFVRERLSVLEQQRNTPTVSRQSPGNLTRKIRSIMHVFGDCKKPLWESVLFMEKILRQQMNLLLTKAAAVASMRGGNEILPQDLIFLLRKNKVKLKRLLLYLALKDAKEVLSKPNSTKHSDVVESQTKGKRVKCCLEFLNEIDSVYMYTGIMETDIPDPDYQRRLERKYKRSCDMSDDEYIEFSKIAGTTFLPKNGMEEFLDWLMEDNVTHLVPTHFALEIINYFARETIEEIVDKVVSLKEEKGLEYTSSNNEQESDQMSYEDSDHDDSEQINKNKKYASKEQSNAVTVSEIKEVLQPYTRGDNHSFIFAKDHLDGLVLDVLLCR